MLYFSHHPGIEVYRPYRVPFGNMLVTHRLSGLIILVSKKTVLPVKVIVVPAAFFLKKQGLLSTLVPRNG